MDATSGKIGDVTVKWNITPNDDNAYQNNLDATLLKQESAAADDKIDLFLVEADYALKYVDTDYTMPVADLGITDADLANQYQYTKDIVTDSNGVLKGVSWQGLSLIHILYGYACLYKSETGDVDQIPATELTITFVCYHYPVKMLQKLKYDKKMSIKNIENGIYYLIGDLIPIQLIIIPKLSKENNYWLNNLRNDLKSGGEIRNFIEQYGKKKESKLYQALEDTIMRANWKELKEERRMCQALRELFADDLRESELKLSLIHICFFYVYFV